MRLTTRELDVDVLIAGGGGAACMAAIKAAEAGCQPLVIAKSGIPGGVTLQARAGFQAALGHANAEDGPDVHFRDTMKAGFGLANAALVRVMVDMLPDLVREMAAWGVDFVKTDDGRFHQKWRSGSTYPRHVHHHDISGKAIGQGLSRRMKDLGINTLPGSMLLRVLVEDGRVVGALVLRRQAAELLLVRTHAVILACGGGGQVYQVTDNAAGMTGDGYVAAYLAGASLVDMEMVEFQFAVAAPEKMVGYPPNSAGWVTEGARFYNRLGERFIRRYAPGKREIDLTRAELIRYVSLEIFAGRGTEEGGVYLDGSDIPPERQAAFAPHITAAFRNYGIDLTCQPMIVAPACHTFLGGAVIDADAQTCVAGLYAPGETAGGVHGANRLGGNPLAEALAFGARAGLHAGQQVKGRPAPRPSFGPVLDPLERQLERKGTVDPKALRDRVRETMQRCGTMIRDAARLEEGLSHLRRVGIEYEQLGGAESDAPGDFIHDAYTAYNTLLTGMCVLKSALARTETRGLHYRQDYPESGGEQWERHVQVVMPTSGPVWEPEVRLVPHPLEAPARGGAGLAGAGRR